MSRSRSKAPKRRIQGFFIPLPLSLVHHPAFYTLSASAHKVFMLLLSQVKFRGGNTINNGNLSATFLQAQKWGINSKTTLKKCIDELVARGLIELTRQVYFSAADRSRPNLYAISLWAVDDCKTGEVKPTRAPSAKWMNWKQPEAEQK